MCVCVWGGGGVRECVGVCMCVCVFLCSTNMKRFVYWECQQFITEI